MGVAYAEAIRRAEAQAGRYKVKTFYLHANGYGPNILHRAHSRGPGCGQPALPYRRREATRNYRYSQRGLVAHHLNNGYNEPAIRRARQRGKTLLRHSYLPAVNPTRRCNACRVTVVRMSLSFSLSRRLVLVATRFTFIVWSTFSTI